MNKKVKNEYTERLRLNLKADLNARNNTMSAGILAIPVLWYCFGVINWRFMS
jgi:hypothetical protein